MSKAAAKRKGSVLAEGISSGIGFNSGETDLIIAMLTEPSISKLDWNAVGSKFIPELNSKSAYQRFKRMISRVFPDIKDNDGSGEEDDGLDSDDASLPKEPKGKKRKLSDAIPKKKGEKKSAGNTKKANSKKGPKITKTTAKKSNVLKAGKTRITTPKYDDDDVMYETETEHSKKENAADESDEDESDGSKKSVKAKTGIKGDEEEVSGESEDDTEDDNEEDENSGENESAA